MERLVDTLRRIDGRGYRAYQDLRGRYRGRGFVLHVDRVQGDPFAAPSELRAVLEPAFAGFGEAELGSAVRRVALADFLTRSLGSAVARRGGRRMGSGSSGRIGVCPCGQEILERTACEVTAGAEVTVRFTVGLPAEGRRIAGRAAATLLAEELPALLADSLRRDGLDGEALVRHVDAAEDQQALRAALRGRGLVAFLAEGARLPRASGASDAPATGEVVPLVPPEELAVTLRAPHAGEVRGLGVPEGVTLIVGGGYHGKSTLLAAVARGVYDHVPGDGRELCVTDRDAVVVRAEDGRAVAGVDIRAFVDGLPLGRGTERFSTQDASGSTSQAAAIVEALEAGARVLLVDEDTAATNFMIRDRRMRRLVPEAKEPITPFVDRVRELGERLSVSTVLVLGGSGDYLEVADRVIRMEGYRPHDVTAEARAIARELPARDEDLAPPPAMAPPAPRRVRPGSLDPSRGRRAERVKAVRTRDIVFGESEIDVSLVEQLVDPAQARAVGDALLEATRQLGAGPRSVPELLDAIEARVGAEGLAALQPGPAGDRARPRRHEVAAALNRLRTLEVT